MPSKGRNRRARDYRRCRPLSGLFCTGTAWEQMVLVRDTTENIKIHAPCETEYGYTCGQWAAAGTVRSELGQYPAALPKRRSLRDLKRLSRREIKCAEIIGLAWRRLRRRPVCFGPAHLPRLPGDSQTKIMTIFDKRSYLSGLTRRFLN
jgi:hypothetical protein